MSLIVGVMVYEYEHEYQKRDRYDVMTMMFHLEAPATSIAIHTATHQLHTPTSANGALSKFCAVSDSLSRIAWLD
jgi:hypothetical protein